MTEKQYPGGAGATDAYIEGESAGLREEYGEALETAVAGDSAASGSVTDLERSCTDTGGLRDA